jgi:ankyrin repeat protein
VALFWGHREVVDLLGLEPRNLRVAAGLGRVDLIDELAGAPAAGAHRGFYRPHGGFPAWQPSDDPHEVLDEALVWAAKSDRVEAVERLVELGADVDGRGTFGGPDHGRGVTALHLAAQSGRVGAVETLLELRAEPTIRDTSTAGRRRAGRRSADITSSRRSSRALDTIFITLSA